MTDILDQVSVYGNIDDLEEINFKTWEEYEKWAESHTNVYVRAMARSLKETE